MVTATQNTHDLKCFVCVTGLIKIPKDFLHSKSTRLPLPSQQNLNITYSQQVTIFSVIFSFFTQQTTIDSTFSVLAFNRKGSPNTVIVYFLSAFLLTWLCCWWSQIVA